MTTASPLRPASSQLSSPSHGFRKRSILPDTPPPESPGEMSPFSAGRTEKQLPLKKRFHSDGQSQSDVIPSSQDIEQPKNNGPMDFSLPNRSRAKVGSKNSSTASSDSDSVIVDSPESLPPTESDAGKPLDLTKTVSSKERSISFRSDTKGLDFSPKAGHHQILTESRNGQVPNVMDALGFSGLGGFDPRLLPFALPFSFGPLLPVPIPRPIPTEPKSFPSINAEKSAPPTFPPISTHSLPSSTLGWGQLLQNLIRTHESAQAAQKASEIPVPNSWPQPEQRESHHPAGNDEPAGPSETFIINPATGNRVRRNYKNMTRERRMEANARERTRVHTIGAAFDQLQKLVPALSVDQKLSKLSILRIACKYIMLLAAMSGRDYSMDQNGYSVEECIEMLNDTITAEGKLKRR